MPDQPINGGGKRSPLNPFTWFHPHNAGGQTAPAQSASSDGNVTEQGSMTTANTPIGSGPVEIFTGTVNPVPPITSESPIPGEIPVIPGLPIIPGPTVIAGGAVSLSPGQVVTTNTPVLDVAGFRQPGLYTFSLAVEDDLGVSSKPVTVQVKVTNPLG